MPPSEPPLTYRSAGVDVEAGEALVDAIKPIAARTRRDGVVSGLGGFGAVFEIPDKFRRPLLVSGTDGVGTKLRLAFEMNRHDTIGVDLVAMCANDVVVQGAEPLFFLDYFATGHLVQETAVEVIKGIGAGCEQAGAALVGGETAEMPGMYGAGEYDLAGFCVGAVEKEAVIDGSSVQPGDAVIGLASSGPHSNGYSLIRKIIEAGRIDLKQAFEGETLGDALLRPTRIYVKPLLDLIQSIEVRAIAHITGGGIAANLERVIPNGISMTLSSSAWRQPVIFDWIREHGRIEPDEMLKTFNCGLGMIVLIPKPDVAKALDMLKTNGIQAWEIGHTQTWTGEAVVIHE